MCADSTRLGETIWMYEQTHPLRPHQMYWKMPIKKPTPSEAAKILSETMDDDIMIHANKRDAWTIAQQVQRHCLVRNEMGLWNNWQLNELTDTVLAADAQQALEEQGNTRWFVSSTAMLHKDAQLDIATTILGPVCGPEVASDFFLLGRLYADQYQDQSMLIIQFKHAQQRSIGIKILRRLFDICETCAIRRVFLVTPSQVSNVNISVLKKECPNIALELWSNEEMLIDFFGSHINNPIAVFRTNQCYHTIESPVCEECCSFIVKTLCDLRNATHALPIANSECALSRRFGLVEGDLIDSARPSGRFLRNFIVTEEGS